MPDAPTKMTVVGRLKERWLDWVEIGASPRVVAWIRDGVGFPQVEELERRCVVTNKISVLKEVEWTDEEVKRLCGSGALVEVGEMELLAVSLSG